MSKKSLALRVLVWPNGLPDRWVALCLDRYMVAEGDSPEEASTALERVCRAEVAYGVERGFEEHPLERLPPAPHKYHAAFEAAVLPPKPRMRKTQQHFSLELEQRLIAQPV